MKIEGVVILWGEWMGGGWREGRRRREEKER